MSFASKVHELAGKMRALFEPTPLQHNLYLSQKYDAEIWLKREDLSPVRSYKIRGAFNAMSRQLEKNPEQASFVCASAGNHAQGVAYAAQYFGVKAKIYMPVTTPGQKIMKTENFGAEHIEIVLIGDYFDETLAAAQKDAHESGACFLPPFDHSDIIMGQATVADEIFEQLGGAPDLLIAGVGGGGLSSGLKKYFHARQEGIPDLYLCEPSGGRSLYMALKKGGLVTLDHVDNFVDGAAVARIGDINFDILKDTPLSMVRSIPENRLCATMIEMLNSEGIVLEPAGALTIDALKDLKSVIKGETVVCVTSGGNFDFERLPDVKERALKSEGLKKYFILRMPQRPGALRDFLELLGPEDDIARFEYLKKSARNFGSVLIGIESKAPDAFIDLFNRMDEAGFAYQDITDNDALSQFLV